MAKPERFGDVDAYVRALGEALTECPPKVEELPRAHYQARGHVRTYPQLAEMVGYANYGGVNSQYGRLARRVASGLGVTSLPEEGFWGIVLVEWAGSYDPSGTRFRLRSQVVEALEQLGFAWASRARSSKALHPTPPASLARRSQRG